MNHRNLVYVIMVTAVFFCGPFYTPGWLNLSVWNTRMQKTDYIYILSKGVCICLDGLCKTWIPWEEEMTAVVFDTRRKARGSRGRLGAPGWLRQWSEVEGSAPPCGLT